MATSGIPLILAPIKSHLVVAKQYEKKDPTVSFYVYFNAVQMGLSLAKGAPDAKAFIGRVMDTMEKLKKATPDKECFEETVGQAHLEETALKLFIAADNLDRSGNFNKDMIKQFFTSSILFGALNQFGDVSDDILEKQKYAKYKAAEIGRCLKMSITPTSGPPGGENQEFNLPVPPPSSSIGFGGFIEPSGTASQQPVYPEGGVNSYGPPASVGVPVYPPPESTSPVPKPRSTVVPPPENPQPSRPAPPTVTPTTPAVAGGGGVYPHLTFKEYSQASKLCRYASSALDYEDARTAIDNLNKALCLLQTGKAE